MLEQRNVDLYDLLAGAATGFARCAVVAHDLTGLDADTVARLGLAGVGVVAVVGAGSGKRTRSPARGAWGSAAWSGRTWAAWATRCGRPRRDRILGDRRRAARPGARPAARRPEPGRAAPGRGVGPDRSPGRGPPSPPVSRRSRPVAAEPDRCWSTPTRTAVRSPSTWASSTRPRACWPPRAWPTPAGSAPPVSARWRRTVDGRAPGADRAAPAGPVGRDPAGRLRRDARLGGPAGRRRSSSTSASASRTGPADAFEAGPAPQRDHAGGPERRPATWSWSARPIRSGCPGWPVGWSTCASCCPPRPCTWWSTGPGRTLGWSRTEVARADRGLRPAREPALPVPRTGAPPTVRCPPAGTSCELGDSPLRRGIGAVADSLWGSSGRPGHGAGSGLSRRRAGRGRRSCRRPSPAGPAAGR